LNRIAAILSAIALLTPARFASACGACYGDPNSPLVRGAIAAVLFLIVAVVSVLGVISRYAYKWKKRAEELAATEGL